MIALMLVFLGSGLLIIALAIPMIRRRVRPNDVYGLRTEATFADESVWYEANARSGVDLVVLGTTLIVLALVLPLFGIDEPDYGLLLSAAAVAGALTVAIVGSRRANRLLRERANDAERR